VDLIRFPDTRLKLDRAKRLIALLTEAQQQPDDFDALLDACVGSLREVTWILKKEASSLPPCFLNEWYAYEEALMRSPNNSALPWLRDLRNRLTKERPTPVRTRTHIKRIHIEKVDPGKAFAISGRGEPVWITRNPGGKEVRAHASEFDSQVVMRHFLLDSQPPRPLTIDGIDLTGADALTIVRAYADYLSKLVDRAESHAERLGH
jgi:hypothetical protein